MLRLSDKWAPDLLREPETGMGYQTVTVVLKDGRRFEGITVIGGIIGSVNGSHDIPFEDCDIDKILVTHNRMSSAKYPDEQG